MAIDLKKYLPWLKPSTKLSERWKKAIALREVEWMRFEFQTGSAEGKLPDLGVLQREAARKGWDVESINKMSIYHDLYGDQIERGYRRVVAEHRAQTDYKVMMVAVARCYSCRKYAEAMELFLQFERSLLPDGEVCEYYGQGIALIVASRRDISEARNYADVVMVSGERSLFFAINAFFVYFELGDHERVRELYEYLVTNQSNNPHALQALGWVELARGYYGEGFRLLEARMALKDLVEIMPESVLPKERWNGVVTPGLRLLVVEEQGIGDTIMMARYLAELKSRGIDVIFAGRELVVSLLEENFPTIEYFIRNKTDFSNVEFQCWTPMMSLPFYLNTTVENVPGKSGYLAAPADQKKYWKGRVTAGKGRLRVGIAWSGNPHHKFDKRRSLRFEDISSRISSLQEIDFFALQTAVPDIMPGNLHAMSDEFTTFADTAALIEMMDIVVSVDTSVIHLSGALGKKSLLMLPFRYEWRWGLDGPNNAWYDSVKVIRQVRHADWTEVLDFVFSDQLPRLAKELTE